MIADRLIGQRNGVVIGALSMSAGHIAMTFDKSFLVALLLLVIGSGFLKGVARPAGLWLQLKRSAKMGDTTRDT